MDIDAMAKRIQKLEAFCKRMEPMLDGYERDKAAVRANDEFVRAFNALDIRDLDLSGLTIASAGVIEAADYPRSVPMRVLRQQEQQEQQHRQQEQQKATGALHHMGGADKPNMAPNAVRPS